MSPPALGQLFLQVAGGATGGLIVAVVAELLRARADRQRIRLNRFSEIEAEATRDVFAKLVRAQEAVGAFVSYEQFGEAREVQAKQAVEELNAFVLVVEQNAIVFRDEHLLLLRDASKLLKGSYIQRRT